MKPLLLTLSLLWIMSGGAHADLLLEELPNSYGIPYRPYDPLVSVDACTESTFVALTSGGWIFRSELPSYWPAYTGTPPDIRITGDTTSLIGDRRQGRKVICEDENTFLVMGIRDIFRVKVAERKIESIFNSGSNLRNFSEDDFGNRYAVTSFELFKLGGSQPLAKMADAYFAVEEENRFLGINHQSIFNFKNGTVDSTNVYVGSPLMLMACLRIPGGYLVVDERGQIFFFDPEGNTLKKWASPDGFSWESANGSPLMMIPYGKFTLISSGGSIFSLGNGESDLIREGLRNYKDSSLFTDESGHPVTISAISRAKADGNIYVAGEDRIYRLKGTVVSPALSIRSRKGPSAIKAVPVSIGKNGLPVLVNGKTVSLTKRHKALGP